MKQENLLDSILFHSLHKIIECLRLEKISGDHLAQFSCCNMATQTQLPRSMSRCLLNATLCRGRDTAASFGKLCLYSVICTVRYFLTFRGNLLHFSICPLLLLLSLAASFQVFVFIYIYTDEMPSEPSLLQAEPSQLSQPFLTGEVLQSPHHLH